MKKIILISCSGMIISSAAFSQPVSDRAVVPVAVTLNQILRIHVTNGGNIEFVFNTIDDYKNGQANTAFYDTDVVIASSTVWRLNMGAEDATFMGTDNPVNTMPNNNVGFFSTWTGLNTCCTPLTQVNGTGSYTNNWTGTANGLALFAPGIAGSVLATSGTGNGGDILDNAFTINWEAGTQTAGGTTPMNATSILVQTLPPDRYVNNVLLELSVAP